MSRPYAFHVILMLSIVFALPPVSARGDPVIPDFDPANFDAGAPIDNPYFPLVPGTTFLYQATLSEDGETFVHREQDAVTAQTVSIAGVLARVVHNTVHIDGQMLEDTFDYYAQDKVGNVWYLGEDTKEFERDDDGNIISTDTSGSWRAGQNGAKPGFIMPNAANGVVGFEYFQEHAPADEALDRAKIVTLEETVTVPFGTFGNVLKTLEETELEPGKQEHKFYAPGVGQVLVHEDLSRDGTPTHVIPLVSMTRGGPQVIPLPPAAWTGMATLALLLAGKGVRRLRPTQSVSRGLRSS